MSGVTPAAGVVSAKEVGSLIILCRTTAIPGIHSVHWQNVSIAANIIKNQDIMVA